jgi:hypothetical protein
VEVWGRVREAVELVKMGIVALCVAAVAPWQAICGGAGPVKWRLGGDGGVCDSGVRDCIA